MNVYAIRLEGTPVGAAYLNLSGRWEARLDTPKVFRKREEAEAEAFPLAVQSEYFGRVTVIELAPTVSRWVLA